ncbi:universal stress protein PHOS34 isoform X2 [Cynara cardunculus var. scolymus]|uniref:universal stress protein PHOS34-like isoform X2 n=1 Tax=Cynara cardunculus var. scolymus TaxID=59895 RepID=UPI000D626A48|nr:universal stress protein PHOS34-like isoform X2 [Cynara cardunculus var. scolymus]XP_024974628.1 universal stress protein PHOS34 isoform X2 [Cynara cardunculus var. scolymus]
METPQKPLMIVGLDDSDHSFYALQWTLDHFPNSPFKLLLLHSKPSPTSAIGFAGPGAADVFPFVDSDLKKIAARVVEKVDDVNVEVVEGDARNVLCEAVDRHHAAMLVVGSHGYGAIKRAVLGSVSDYVTHHAHCTVMVVKKPKTKH